MYKEYQGKGDEGSGMCSSVRTISGVSKETETKGKQQCLELKEDSAAPSCIIDDDDIECSTEKKETNTSPDRDQRTHPVSNYREESEREDRETTQHLKAVPCVKFSPAQEAIIKSCVSEDSTGIAETIEISVSKADELVEETVAVTGDSSAIQTTLEGETPVSPERLEKSAVEVEHEDDFVDLKDESSMPLPSEELAEMNKEHNSNKGEMSKQEKAIEKQPESVLLKSEDTEVVDGKKQELTSLPETVSSAGQEVVTRLDSEGKRKLQEEKILSETKTAGKNVNAHEPEPAGASDKRIARLDVSSVASDTERLELKANTCLETRQPPRSIPEVNPTCPPSV